MTVGNSTKVTKELLHVLTFEEQKSVIATELTRGLGKELVKYYFDEVKKYERVNEFYVNFSIRLTVYTMKQNLMITGKLQELLSTEDYEKFKEELKCLE